MGCWLSRSESAGTPTSDIALGGTSSRFRNLYLRDPESAALPLHRVEPSYNVILGRN